MTDHRTTRPLLAVATIGTLCVGLTACGGSDSPAVTPPPTTATTSSAAPTSESTPSSSSPSSSSSEATPSSSSAAAPAAFKVGQCLTDTVDWAVTPCNQQHKLEVMSVVKTSKDADDILKRGVLRTWTCNNAVAKYVGEPSAAFSRILDQPVPTAVDSDAAHQIVCAAAVAKPDDSGYEDINYALKNRIKDKGYVNYRICTKERPSKTDSPKIVPCTDPHRAETIGGYVIGTADGKYPGSKAVDKRALQKCVPLAKNYIGAGRSDVIAAANSTGARGWKQGTTMTACFVEATNGTFTKPLKGIKNKPLSAYK
ncbi:septum formation family protein [Flexivirga sp.]|uniref:septum formation family protein n=1 Tax=Flexivirga sp. TaxID=1962927 RepID=UPI002D80A15C|nr:septum formation family protein [Flexivirga sp.]